MYPAEEATPVKQTKRLVWFLTIVLSLSLVAAACGDSDDSSSDDGGATTTAAGDSGSDSGSMAGTLIGAGASSQKAAMDAWKAGFQTANPDVTVNYDPIGSGGGGEQFLSGATMFAGSDAYLDEEELAAAVDRCPGERGAINLPHYISPVAAAFNLPGIETLNMTPATLAGIFAETITNWNDAAIAADNPGVELPDLAINPVHRSDKSGTSENFTDYLAAAAPDVWTFGPIEEWPGDLGGEGADGTSGVVAAITAGEGSIGYADASQVAGLGAVAIKVGNEFVAFTPEAAGRIVDVSEVVAGRGEFDFAIEVNRTTEEAGVYPVALVSYHIVCLDYPTQEEADLVKAFMTYIGSAEGQATSSEFAGSAPISDEFRQRLAVAIDAIGVAG